MTYNRKYLIPRILIIAAIALILILGTVTKFEFAGSAKTRLEVNNTPVGPMHVEASAGIGNLQDMPWLNERSSAPVVPANSPEDATLVPNAPFDGPTAEEQRVLDELKTALAEFLGATNMQMQLAFQQLDAEIASDGAEVPPSRSLPKPRLDVPDSIFLPQRHLTTYELTTMKMRAADLRKATAQIKRIIAQRY